MKVAILSGSVYGTAEEVARHAQKLLSAAGLEASHLPRASLDELKAFAPEAFLVVTSTTGMGELPDNLQPLYYASSRSCRLRANTLIASSSAPSRSSPNRSVSRWV